jgi:AraC-like DNA-binding protein
MYRSMSDIEKQYSSDAALLRAWNADEPKSHISRVAVTLRFNDLGLFLRMQKAAKRHYAWLMYYNKQVEAGRLYGRTGKNARVAAAKATSADFKVTPSQVRKIIRSFG